VKRSRTVFILALLGLVDLIPASRAQGQQPTPAALRGIPGAIEYRVNEPVFGGVAYVFEAGERGAPAVVLVHGLGDAASDDWDPILPGLAQRYHVLTFDLPGFGRSEKQNVLYSPFRYATFIKWIVDQRVDGPFTLVGHSMGGVAALRFATLFPRNLKELVLLDVPGILYRSAAFSSAGKFVAAPYLGGVSSGSLDLVRNVVGLALGAIEGRSFTPDVNVILASRTLREKVLKGRPDLIAGLALSEEDFSRSLELVKTPVTLLWGAADDLATLRTARVLRDALPDARLVELPGVGHTPMSDDPALVLRLLLQAIETPPARAEVARETEKPTKRKLKLSGESGKTVSGVFGDLEIEDCHDLELRQVVARSIRVTGSSIRLDETRVEGDEVALVARDSTVTMTGGLLQGDVVVDAERSDVDLAGVDLRGRTAFAITHEWGRLILSICKGRLGERVFHLHGLVDLTPELPSWPE
jgi:pimeloyl-ACP methyl ester carboxylesterase